MPDRANANINNNPPNTRVRVCRDRLANSLKAIAPRPPKAAAIPAHTPKWWVHFVGVKLIKNRVPMKIIISRSDGPRLDPGTLPFRSIDANTNTMLMNAINTANRRENDPSTSCWNSTS